MQQPRLIRRDVIRGALGSMALLSAGAQAATGRSIKRKPFMHASGLVDDPSTYYDIIEPVNGSTKPPLLLIPGGAHTGSCYLRTADGRPGWAYRFVDRGYRVAVVDWPGCGRSGYVPPDQLVGDLVVEGLGKVLQALGEPAIVMTHSMGGAYGWKLLEKHRPKIVKLIGVAPGMPGNIQPAPIILRETDDTIEAQRFAGSTVVTLNRKAPFISGADFVGQKLVGKSELFPRDQTASYTASLIPIPPRLLIERFNIGGSQLKVTDFAGYKDARVMVLTGTNDVDHPQALDKSIVDWLNQNGARADYIYLGDKGIRGNGHMMMMESNSDTIADLLVSWMEGA